MSVVISITITDIDKRSDLKSDRSYFMPRRFLVHEVNFGPEQTRGLNPWTL